MRDQNSSESDAFANAPWTSYTSPHAPSRHPTEPHSVPNSREGCEEPLVASGTTSVVDKKAADVWVTGVTTRSSADGSKADGGGGKAASRSPRLLSTLKSWALEISSLLISVLAIGAIVIILFRQNNQPISAWKFPLTLNTVVATLGTVSRTSLAFAMSACIGQQKWSWLRRRPDTIRAFERFDEASRGPWGGSRLFFWLRLRHWAALGALVTVGTVAFDPFLQAILSTYGQLDDAVANSTGATIGQALRVDGGSIIDVSGGPLMAFNLSSGLVQITISQSRPDFGIVSSLYSGFHETNPNPLAFGCPTGNCTWPAFVSGAICSSCEDVSSELTFSTRFGDKNGSNLDGVSNVYFDGNYTIFSLPESEIKNWDGMLEDKEQDMYQYSTGASMKARTLMTVKTLFNSNRTLRHTDLQTLIMAFLVIKAQDEWLEGKIPWESSHPVATECAMYLCANAYQVRSKGGVLEENVLASWAVRNPASNKIIRPLKPGQESEIDAGGYDLYNPSIDLVRHDLQLDIPQEQSSTFAAQHVNISHSFIRSTIDYLSVFTSYSDKYGQPTKSLIAYPDPKAPPFVDALWRSKSLNQTFQNVARSLTNQVRNTSPDRHQGITQNWAIHIHVDWTYMAFPIAMLVFGILYVILIIAESSRLRLPIWKESAIPALLYGFDDETQKLLRDRENNKQGDGRNMSIRYDFDKQQDYLRLVSH